MNIEACVELPISDGKVGDFKVESFFVSEEQAKIFNMKQDIKGLGRGIISGEYKRLIFKNEVVMSNTPAEIYDHIPFFREVQKRGGHILINGLGLGMCINAVLEFKNIKSITVYELEQDVIDLVAPTFFDDEKVHIVKRNAFDGPASPDCHFDVVWHDIWSDICHDNYWNMLNLMEKYDLCCDWQSCWCMDICARLVE